MGRLSLTVTQRLVGAILLNGIFSFVAVTFALANLNAEDSHIERMVSVDFRALNMARDLRDNILAQERLDRQLSVIKDHELVDLLGQREHDFDAEWQLFAGMFPGQEIADVRTAVDAHLKVLRRRDAAAVTDGVVRATGALAPGPELQATRDAVAGALYDFWIKRNQLIDEEMHQLSKDSAAALRWTFFLVAVGMALGLPMAVSVVINLHRSVKRLTRATEQVGAGAFNVQIEADGHDEFGALAGAFVEMGKKLKALQERQLDANPLTHLPGNRAIEQAIEARIASGRPFAHLYVDLDNFKAYNDRYGYQKGNEVIARLGTILREEAGAADDAMVGHVGGDDYVVLMAPEPAEALARAVIARFDRDAPSFYSDEDLRAGFILAKDRYGVERRFPVISISIAIIFSDNFAPPSAAALSHEAARMKEHLKNQPGSNYLVDRRRGS